MPSSRSSRSVLLDPNSRSAQWLTWIIRELTACVFIFSGFVKAIDPWGTLYKVNDYLAAMHLNHVWPNLVIVGVFFLCGIEFLLGAFLATGSFRRGASVLTLLFMAVMLPLTLWIAVYDPVPDCGCFGDALILTNWETLWKNVVLTVFALWLVIYNRYCRCLIMPALQWLGLIATAIFIFIIELIGFVYQPLIDFRPYPVGSVIAIDGEDDSDTEPEFVFIYRKDGVEKEFSLDSIPDESVGWEFVDRKEVNTDNEIKQLALKDDTKEFHIWEGDEDVTEDVITSDGELLILTMPEMERVSISTVWKINSLYDWASAHNIGMIAVAAGSAKDIAVWKDLSMPEYPIYTADDTSIKELVRGNPAVIYLHKGEVKWKSSLKALNSDDFMTDKTLKNPMDFARDNGWILRTLTWGYLAVMGFLILCSLIPALGRAVLRHTKHQNPHANI